MELAAAFTYILYTSTVKFCVEFCDLSTIWQSPLSEVSTVLLFITEESELSVLIGTIVVINVLWIMDHLAKYKLSTWLTKIFFNWKTKLSCTRPSLHLLSFSPPSSSSDFLFFLSDSLLFFFSFLQLSTGFSVYLVCLCVTMYFLLKYYNLTLPLSNSSFLKP